MTETFFEPRRSATGPASPGGCRAPRLRSGKILVLGDELAGGERRALRVAKDGHPHERAVGWRNQDLAAKAGGPLGSGVGVIGAEGNVPMGRGGRVVAGDGDDRSHHVLEAGGAELRGHGADSRCQSLEVVAVARQRPHLARREAERAPPEYGAVEGLRAAYVTCVQAVEVERAGLVDDLRPAVLSGLPHREHSALRV